MRNSGREKAPFLFVVAFVAIALCFMAGVLKTNAYNHAEHEKVFSGEGLFTAENDRTEAVTVTAVARDDSWGKIFDFDNEGLTENNYEAHTYDFTVFNNTKDKVADFTYRFVFSHEAYLASAWNGSLEIHQHVGGDEIVATVPDLRQFDPTKYPLEVYVVDGEPFVTMQEGDYLVYTPSTSTNAMEVPIEAYEGTTPGIIMYVKMGESIEDSTLALDYRFHRVLTSEPLFWVSMVGLLVWLVAAIVYAITSAQIRRYQKRHERDNIIINESIETFTGFIDAKDPYTNGHSKRVAIYTRLIAQELGYEGDELDRIYYVALLHDCGKIGVPDSILGKPGKLTDEEFDIIKSHTVRGGEILSSFKSLENAGEGALYHHERYDGRGYPEGRAGEDIPFIARMICVADSFDAMNTNRVYRNRLTKEHIINEIETNKGKQFDPKVADVMLKLLREGKITLDADVDESLPEAK